MNRRTFVQISTGALLTAASSRLVADSAIPSITRTDDGVEVKAPNYSWRYTQSDDTFNLRDSRNRVIVSGKVQPAVIVATVGQPASRLCIPGRPSGHDIEHGRITFKYEGVNGSSRLSMTWRFDEHGIWTDPIVFEVPTEHDVVSIRYFGQGSGTSSLPSLQSSYLVVPGIFSGSSVSPIVGESVHLDESVWLGRGGSSSGLSQQWGLPVHYFCGFSIDRSSGERNMYTEGKSDAFACGLADLPGGDLFLQLHEGKCSPWIDYRGDLWKHLRGPGRLSLGATFLWTIAPDYYQAIAGYYEELVQAKIIQRHHNSPRKTAIALTPQFCTWGAQVDRNKGGENLDEAFLNQVYRELRASGMKAGLISFDDKWEGTYGSLVHSAARLPHFEQFLNQLRADGYRIGMWAALMRCERPSDLGLTEENMLLLPDGKPHLVNSQYYILDFTQPIVAKALSEIARNFVRRYKPDLLKFDFGYELPAVSVAAPRDKNLAGERLMFKGLDVVIKAMREENPDLVVMYYNLSPLFLDYFDLHSPDDLWAAAGEYDLEANRRFFFSCLLAPLGIPTYGSSGYDWTSAPNIWFDSAAMGTIGSLNDFQGDEQGEASTPALIARYNGIAKALRPASTFEILPLDTIPEAPTLGAHARSWARFEDGCLVMLAYRPLAPGEENSLMQPKIIDSRVRDIIRCGVPVVVSSRTSESLSRCTRLAVVPYGDAEIVLHREQGTRAEIHSHYLRDSVTQSHTTIEDGQLKLRVPILNSAGEPLEWIEVFIS
jgi:hypothetical protein